MCVSTLKPCHGRRVNRRRFALGGLATTNLTYSSPRNSVGQVLVETLVVAKKLLQNGSFSR